VSACNIADLTSLGLIWALQGANSCNLRFVYDRFHGASCSKPVSMPVELLGPEHETSKVPEEMFRKYLKYSKIVMF